MSCSGLSFALYPVYLRGEAYVAAHQGSAAAAEFQKILDHPGVVVNEPIGALAHLGLARAYALSGDTAKAQARVSGFPRALERRRPRHPHPEGSQGGVREAAVALSAQWKSIVGVKVVHPDQQSHVRTVGLSDNGRLAMI